MSYPREARCVLPSCEWKTPVLRKRSPMQRIRMKAYNHLTHDHNLRGRKRALVIDRIVLPLRVP